MPTDVYDHACTACPLHKAAKTVCLPAAGTRTYPALVVGEAPGRQEDERGVPFVGRAGETLNRALIAAFGDEDIRNKIMVTNTCKCRPPANRTPTPVEIDTCTSLYLVEEIHEIDPIAILALGSTPLRGLLGITGITAARGKWHLLNRDKETWVMPTWHPSYTNYNPEAYHELQSDCEKFAEKVLVGEEVPL